VSTNTRFTGVVEDELSGLVSIIAPGRRLRGTSIGTASRDRECPFCDNDADGEVARVGEPGAAWQAKALRNLFPLIDAGPGSHELIVVSPDHNRHFHELEPSEMLAALNLMVERSARLLVRHRGCVTLFANVGAGAGASQAHPHVQLVALDFVPPVLAAEVSKSVRGPCVLCAPPTPELVVIDGPVRVICPPARRSRWELLIYPAEHLHHFGQGGQAELGQLAVVMSDILRRLQVVSDGADYNLIWHSSPAGSHPGFHWHLHVVPRSTTPGGFEVGTGLWVADMDSKEAATALVELGPAQIGVSSGY
jgi:UDPglucose--hexose-1-phosphate uridylyltransferase